MCRLDLNMDLPQAQTTSVGVASQASQEQVSQWLILPARIVSSIDYLVNYPSAGTRKCCININITQNVANRCNFQAQNA